MLSEHIDEMQRLSKILIEYETIDREQFQRLLAGEPAEDVFKDQEKRTAGADRGGSAQGAVAAAQSGCRSRAPWLRASRPSRRSRADPRVRRTVMRP